MIEIVLAFAAGILTVAAPCVLPMLPILLGASTGRCERLRPLFIVTGFVLAFSGFVILFAVFPALPGRSYDAARTTSIILLGTFGAILIWPRPYEWLVGRISGTFTVADDLGRRVGPGNIGGLILGSAMGIVWTPCAGPILGSILTLIATSKNFTSAGILLFGYAIGAAVPMLIIAYSGQYITTHALGFAHYAPVLQRALGVAVLLVAVALYTQYDAVITLWLTSVYPNLQTGL
jgi:cytochrome c-type biogenesis protein